MGMNAVSKAHCSLPNHTSDSRCLPAWAPSASPTGSGLECAQQIVLQIRKRSRCLDLRSDPVQYAYRLLENCFLFTLARKEKARMADSAFDLVEHKREPVHLVHQAKA